MNDPLDGTVNNRGEGRLGGEPDHLLAARMDPIWRDYANQNIAVFECPLQTAKRGGELVRAVPGAAGLPHVLPRLQHQPLGGGEKLLSRCASAISGTRATRCSSRIRASGSSTAGRTRTSTRAGGRRSRSSPRRLTPGRVERHGRGGPAPSGATSNTTIVPGASPTGGGMFGFVDGHAAYYNWADITPGPATPRMTARPRGYSIMARRYSPSIGTRTATGWRAFA